MRTKLISLLLAATVAATSGLSPAQAQGFDRDAQRQAAAIAIGIATIAIIAKAAEAERDREKERKRERDRERKRAEADRSTIITRSERPLPRVITRDEVWLRDEVRPRAHGRPLSVPASCARRVETDRGVRTAFGAPCLRRAGVDVARLPDRCEQLADVGQRDVRIWGARCLQRNGVRID